MNDLTAANNARAKDLFGCHCRCESGAASVWIQENSGGCAFGSLADKKRVLTIPRLENEKRGKKRKKTSSFSFIREAFAPTWLLERLPSVVLGHASHSC